MPCHVTGGANQTGTVVYDRYAFTRADWQFRQTKTTEKFSDGSYVISRYQSTEKYHDAFQAIENESIKKYGGFFIGRYEAGDKESTEAKSMRTMSSPESNTVTIKKLQVPYNYIEYSKAKSLADQMGTSNNYSSNLFTNLCNSYSWDTALKFIEKTHSKYSIENKNKNEKIIGNFYDVALDYIDIQGNYKTRTAQTSNQNTVVIPTGQTEAVCNIYDMGGNLYEYTTEKTELNSSPNAPYSERGGGAYSSSQREPAGMRNAANIEKENRFAVRGFRLTLFIK